MEDLFNLSLESANEETHAGPPATRMDGSRSRLESSNLDFLYGEYVRSLERGDRKFEHVLRITGIGFATAGAVLFLLTTRNEKIDEWVYWIAPLMLTLLYAWVIQLLHYMTFSSYYARDLEDDIARITGISYFHHEHTVVRVLNSFRTGVMSMRVTYVLMLVFSVGIYIALVSVGFMQLRNQEIPAPQWRQAAYVLLYSILATALLYSAIGLTFRLRSPYELWKNVPAAVYEALRQRSQPALEHGTLIAAA